MKSQDRRNRESRRSISRRFTYFVHITNGRIKKISTSFFYVSRQESSNCFANPKKHLFPTNIFVSISRVVSLFAVVYRPLGTWTIPLCRNYIGPIRSSYLRTTRLTSTNDICFFFWRRTAVRDRPRRSRFISCFSSKLSHGTRFR